jgi:hypothetical protein
MEISHAHESWVFFFPPTSPKEKTASQKYLSRKACHNAKFICPAKYFLFSEPMHWLERSKT